MNRNHPRRRRPFHAQGAQKGVAPRKPQPDRIRSPGDDLPQRKGKRARATGFVDAGGSECGEAGCEGGLKNHRFVTAE